MHFLNKSDAQILSKLIKMNFYKKTPLFLNFKRCNFLIKFFYERVPPLNVKCSFLVVKIINTVSLHNDFLKNVRKNYFLSKKGYFSENGD
jgi:hypothetical protein